MSSSFLKGLPARRRAPRLGAGLLAVAVTSAAGPVMAAEYYLQPIATLTAQTDSNLDLDIGPRRELQGYLADLATLIGIATPDFSATVKPRIAYRYYPDDSPDDRLEGYVDFNSSYRTLRSVAALAGDLEHLDEFNAEYGGAVYNDVNPGLPTVTDTGKVNVGATRDSAILTPTYNYKFTPLTGAGLSGTYQAVSYSPSGVNSHVDFDYYLGRAYVSQAVNQTSTLSFGAYGSKYEATHIASEARGAGGTLDLDTTWTPLFSTEASLFYQHTTIDDVQPEPFSTGVNTLGGSVSGVYKSQVSQFRLNAGRTLAPTGGGSLYALEQLKFEYDRDYTARLSFRGSLLAERIRALTANVSGTDRNFTQALVEVKWMLAPTWFVQGGYQYAWQKYEFDPTGAADNRIYIRVGYQGLPQQR